MGRYLRQFAATFRKGDMVLLLICLLTTAFGCLVISSAANVVGSLRYVTAYSSTPMRAPTICSVT